MQKDFFLYAPPEVSTDHVRITQKNLVCQGLETVKDAKDRRGIEREGERKRKLRNIHIHIQTKQNIRE